MKATCWKGVNKVEVEDVPDPKILSDRDAIIKITSTAICGSDLHLYDGYVPTMRKGDILGHEFMGEVVETGKGVTNLRAGDRVVVPFPIACGGCWSCQHELYSLCDISSGDVIAVFGAGPVGQFAIASAVLLGAERVIAIDQYEYRLAMARNKAGATDTINFSEDADIVEQLKEMTGGRGPDAVIDAVGMEASHGHGVLH